MKKIKNISKKTLLVVVGVLLGASFSAFAAATWQGTDWISNGNIISAQKVKDNFQYLYERVMGNKTLIDTNIVDITNLKKNKGGKFVDGSNPNNAVYTKGNVGVRTNNPAYPLDVTGQMRAGRYNDNAGGWFVDSDVTSRMNAIDLNTLYLRGNLSAPNNTRENCHEEKHAECPGNYFVTGVSVSSHKKNGRMKIRHLHCCRL